MTNLCNDCQALHGRAGDTPAHANLRFKARQYDGCDTATVFTCKACSADLGRVHQSGTELWQICALPAPRPAPEFRRARSTVRY